MDFDTLAAESKAAWDSGDTLLACYKFYAARAAAQGAGLVPAGSSVVQQGDGTIAIVSG